MRIARVALSLSICATACGPRPPAAVPPIDPTQSAAFRLVGQFSIPPLTQFPIGTGLRFGGISGLAATEKADEFLGISDDQLSSRFYRLRLSGVGADFRVTPLEFIALQQSTDSSAQIDPEGIVLNLLTGQLLICSEGVGTAEPRVPPALLQYDRRGRFVRRLVVRDRFIPNPTGPLIKGVRNNIGFESLTLTPDGGRLFSATESAIVQDGELTTFERGASARILEYVARGSSYEPGREFVYRVEPIDKPPFQDGLAVNGLVELLAIDESHLLALERSYVAEAGDTGRNMNRIRLFRISLNGATDVSRFDSLKDVPNVVPVTKVTLLDLSTVPELNPDLAPSLDNFEGMVFGPRLPDGRASLILVSDDNFNQTQRTWTLKFALNGTRRAQRIQ